MIRSFLEWQDNQMNFLAEFTLVWALTGVIFVQLGWPLTATASVVCWCVLMALFALVNAMGWAWTLRNIEIGV